jgi:hypothetical protein
MRVLATLVNASHTTASAAATWRAEVTVSTARETALLGKAKSRLDLRDHLDKGPRIETRIVVVA